jgi:glycosyltransferase involved in cell wall biosynthesis
MLLPEKPKMVQICASLDPKLGGPHKVIVETNKFFASRYNYRLLIFGNSIAKKEPSIVNPTLQKNRFGFMLRKPNHETINAIRDADILIIHGYYLWSTLIGFYYSKTKNIFLMPHGSLENYQDKNGKLRKFIFRFIAFFLLRKRSIHFLVGSEPEVISVRKKFPSNTISVVGLGIESNLNTIEDSNIHQPIKLYCLSRLSHKKRIDLCIRALQKLNLQNRNYHLNIYGTGDISLESELKYLVKELRMDDFVTFHGHVDGQAKDSAIINSDIFLLPSENENFAVAVAESIAFGKPVVVSKFVAMHEFVDQHNVGLTIETLELDELVAAIEEISKNFSTYQKNCVSSAPLLSWDAVIIRWFDAIENNLVENV